MDLRVSCLRKLLLPTERHTRRYDVIIPFGAACSCSQVLRFARLQHLSFPYDWTITQSQRDLPPRADMIASDFQGWFEKQDLVRDPGTISAKGAVMCRNVKTLHAHPHDFIASDDFEQAYPKVREKYDRRIRRMFNLIETAKNVLIVHIDTPIQTSPTPIEDCEYALRRFRERFPGASFDMCLMQLDLGRSLEALIEDRPCENVLRLRFDYKDHTPGVPPYSVNIQSAASALTSRFEVRDYRTAEERATKQKRERRDKYLANGASNAFQYRWIKLRRLFSRLSRLCKTDKS